MRGPSDEGSCVGYTVIEERRYRDRDETSMEVSREEKL